ncbi:transcriptional regulator with XRE-family HTH domain [Kitasatospora sp. MAP12-15]|uniref:Scr1 family TA system antitoxin-like transcriptional regulator n=1 Tax=unclassified Kitasatospora TaxID=2633591 RepID=UPI0024767268|nr:Scr1 family TA system antitoxin-like transcriptional regulator [Kitasatospora sp. MAP12-44]MDH6113406.1 transcriptional regulator with XRE-family HTH domain [Kitasatospora sp. MAP12-44]
MATRRSSEHAPLTPEAWGWMLRDWRERRGWKGAALAREVPCDASLLSRFEGAERAPGIAYAERLDELLLTEGTLVRAWKDVDWQREVVHPDWFKFYVKLESEAELIRGYHVERISGLLQTPAYARALFRFIRPDADGRAISSSVAARMSRQRRFFVPGGPQLVAVLSELAIRSHVGGRLVMREQLEHLLAVGERHPNVIVQVAQFELGERTGKSGGMILMQLPGGVQWAYSESMSSGHFIRDPEVLPDYSRFYDRLRAEALSVSDSARLIRGVMRGLSNVTITTNQSRPIQYSHRKADWLTSSYSQGDGGECVEVALNLAAPDGVVPVRDSKDRQGPQLTFNAAAWSAFTAAVAAGEFGSV